MILRTLLSELTWTKFYGNLEFNKTTWLIRDTINWRVIAIKTNSSCLSQKVINIKIQQTLINSNLNKSKMLIVLSTLPMFMLIPCVKLTLPWDSTFLNWVFLTIQFKENTTSIYSRLSLEKTLGFWESFWNKIKLNIR